MQVFVVKGAEISEKYRGIMDENVIQCECFLKRDRYFYFRKQKKIHDAILREISIENFDLIHSHNFFNGGWAAHQLWKEHEIPYVVTVRNTDLNVFLRIPGFRRLAQIIARDAAGVQFLSETYKNAFLQMCFTSAEREKIEERCAVICNGAESFWLENTGAPKSFHGKTVKLICVGKIDHNKNMETVVKVAKALIQKGFDTKLTLIAQMVDPEVYHSLQISRMKFNYELWHISEGKGKGVSWVLTGVNTVFGAAKKLRYKKLYNMKKNEYK